MNSILSEKMVQLLNTILEIISNTSIQIQRENFLKEVMKKYEISKFRRPEIGETFLQLLCKNELYVFLGHPTNFEKYQ